MKVELTITKKSITILIVFVVLACSFFLLGQYSAPEKENTMECLTIKDLNRSDIAAGIMLSRFCEGMGLSSSVYWQQDQNGNIYAVPICVEVQQ